jgi:hypothetical protein
MTEENTTQMEETAQPDNNVQISVEQICAAILKTAGAIEVSLDDLVANYSGKTIAVDQNPDTKAVTFSLADTPVQQEEDKQESAE